MQRVSGYPNLRKDPNGVVHNVDKDGLEIAKKKIEESQCYRRLKDEVEHLRKLVEELKEKQ